ncbi:MAG: HAD-IB family phosphatase [Sulfolobales archaeon]|nr:HAD-IB family phosphatase [Sulfolobales archaeon]MCX8209121.1 HAD-IB family phosphatase [Sulfolobales archaeon]MDW8010194.1 HAD-IB family phosphatase [Sulfolobales archaeon]
MSLKIKLAVFDLDGVLVEEKSSWEYLHRFFGTYELAAKANYARAFELGLISYSDWMRLDLELMIGSRGTIYCWEVDKAFSEVPIAAGAGEVIEYLRNRGVGVAIVSAGIERLASRIAHALGVDEVYANKLLCDASGRLLPYGVEVVDPLRKNVVIENIAKKLGVSLADTMYVGDSEWDCSALDIVGFPVVVGSRAIKCGRAGSQIPMVYVSNMLELAALLKESPGLF